jgi:hypothetical protein
MTTAAFFAGHDVAALLGEPPSVVLLTGTDDFATLLEAFARVEAASDDRTVVIVGEAMPFEGTPIAASTNDGWRLLHCLAEVRPDLSLCTLPTPPTGLTFVSGLDPASTVLHDTADKLVARFASLPTDDASMVPGRLAENDVSLIVERVRRAPRPGEGAGTGARFGSPDAAALARRVQDLEARDAQLRAELAEARQAVDSAALGWTLDPDSAIAELERMRRTKLYRWTNGLRRLYGRVRPPR